METELAAVEQDVERKRVGKNPFDEKFTSLTESPFTETSAPSWSSSSSRSGGQQQMDTISRHIIVRMEVIAKQVAFLSKETSGQPGRILSVVGGDGGVSSDRQDRNQRKHQASLGGSAHSTDNRFGDEGDGDGIATNKPPSSTPTSPLGDPLPGRLDLFRRLRRGLATAEDLLPQNMLLLSETRATVPPPPPLTTAVSNCESLKAMPAAAAAAASGESVGSSAAVATTAQTFDRPDGKRSGSANNPSCTTSRDVGRDRGVDAGEDAISGAASAAPAGILHGFIKHVKPFSVCFDSRSTSAAAGSAAGAAAERNVGTSAGCAAAAAELSTLPATRGSVVAGTEAQTVAAAADNNNNNNNNNTGEGFGDGSDDSDDGHDGGSGIDDGKEDAASFCDYGDATSCCETACSPTDWIPARHDTTTAPAVAAATMMEKSRDFSRSGKNGDALVGGSESSGSGGEQNRERRPQGAPRKPAGPPAGGSEALRRAKARLQGKRKLANSWQTSWSVSTNNTITKDAGGFGRSSAARRRYRYNDDGRDAGGGEGSCQLESGWRAAAAAATAASASVEGQGTEGGGEGARGSDAGSRQGRGKNTANTFTANNDSNGGTKERKGRGGQMRGRICGEKEAVGGIRSSTGGGGGDGRGSQWSSLSWSSAKKFRERMEASATPAPSASSGTNISSGNKNGRRSGGSGGRTGGGSTKAKTKTITLSSASSSATSTGRKGTSPPSLSFGPLDLIARSNGSKNKSSSSTSLDFPAAAGVGANGPGTYLGSLVNPLRDLAAMRRAFQDAPEPVPAAAAAAAADSSGAAPTSTDFPVPGGAPSPPLTCEGSTRSDDFDFDLGPEFGAGGEGAASAGYAVSGVDDGGEEEALCPGEAMEEEATTPRPSGPSQPHGDTTCTGTAAAAAASKEAAGPGAAREGTTRDVAKRGAAGTCKIDLNNIWRRTGAVSRAISQGSVKQSSLAKRLRESFVRLDIERREKEQEEQQRQRLQQQLQRRRQSLQVMACDHDEEAEGEAGARADGRDVDGDDDGGEDSQGGPSDVEASMSISLRYPPSTEESEPGTNTLSFPEGDEKLGAGGGAGAASATRRGEGAARVFALVVSLAHVHNISAAADGGEGASDHARGGLKGGREGASALSQLRVEVECEGHAAVVTARRR